MYSEHEVSKIALEAARVALAGRPVPTSVPMAEAAKMLNVSISTVTRRRPPRGIGGRIPYTWILEQLAK
jgi:hypothetical protein